MWRPLEKRGFLTRNALFWGEWPMGFFLTLTPAFPDLGFLTPVKGERVRKARNGISSSSLKPCITKLHCPSWGNVISTEQKRSKHRRVWLARPDPVRGVLHLGGPLRCGQHLHRSCMLLKIWLGCPQRAAAKPLRCTTTRWRKGKDPHPQDKIQHLDFTKYPRPLYYKTPPCAFYHKSP